MGEANENRNRSREMLNLSLQLEKYPRDLLQKFMHPGGSQQSHEEDTPTSPSEEIELNLGLSLGGRFGVDKNAKKKLYRSSSIAGPIPISREIDRTITPPVTATTATTNSSTSSSQPMGYQSLVRTSSLPTETEEEWRKRKELQTLRRMAAKRRRNEKQRNASVNSQKADKTEFNLDEERQNRIPLGMKSCGTAGRKAAGSGGTGGGFFQGLGQPSSQGSMESQGGGSSGMSELESKHVQGSSSGSGGEARSSANIQTSQDRSHQEIAASSRTKTNENTSKTAKQEMDDVAKKLERRNSRGSGMNLLEDMPCVFTDGPNGRRIEGILYKYGKGEEVRIMCVCHGSFLSPFEFVKHAGHRDVDNPLRHIVVNPSAAPLS